MELVGTFCFRPQQQNAFGDAAMVMNPPKIPRISREQYKQKQQEISIPYSWSAFPAANVASSNFPESNELPVMQAPKVQRPVAIHVRDLFCHRGEPMGLWPLQKLISPKNNLSENVSHCNTVFIPVNKRQGTSHSRYSNEEPPTWVDCYDVVYFKNVNEEKTTTPADTKNSLPSARYPTTMHRGTLRANKDNWKNNNRPIWVRSLPNASRYFNEYRSHSFSDELRFLDICRESEDQQKLQTKLDDLILEALDVCKTAATLGNQVRNTNTSSILHAGSSMFAIDSAAEHIFSWKEVQEILNKDVQEDSDQQMLSDFMDIRQINEILITQRQKFNSLQDGISCSVLSEGLTAVTNWPQAVRSPRMPHMFPELQKMQPLDKVLSDMVHSENITSIPWVERVSRLCTSNGSMFSASKGPDLRAASANDSMCVEIDSDERNSSHAHTCTDPSSNSNTVSSYQGRYPFLSGAISVQNSSSANECCFLDQSSSSHRNFEQLFGDIIIRPRPSSELEMQNGRITPDSCAEYSVLDDGNNRFTESNYNFKTCNFGSCSIITDERVTTSRSNQPTLTQTCSVSAPSINQLLAEKSRNLIQPGEKEEDKLLESLTNMSQNKMDDARGATKGIFARESTRRGLKNKPRTKPNHCLHLWEFLLGLLNNKVYSPKYIAWTRKDIGEFKLIRTEYIANLWGQSKRRKKMTYEKMARALRYYYKHKVLEKVPHKRLHFRFGKSVLSQIL